MSKSTPIELHPAPIDPEITFHEGLGQELVNAGGIILMIRDGETPQCRELYRLYLAEHRARIDQPLSEKQRQQDALFAAMKRYGFNIVEYRP